MEAKIRAALTTVMSFWCFANLVCVWAHGNGLTEQPLAKIAIHNTVLALRDSASVDAYPLVLGLKVSFYMGLCSLTVCYMLS
uniref:Putative inactive purple acid phosphatase 27 n=1 Tax=Rhizophora mucronata TaxID=61149 RepID=A0A2P2KD27_RHIMU